MCSRKSSCLNCNSDLTSEPNRKTHLSGGNTSVSIGQAVVLIFGSEIDGENSIFTCQTCANVLSQLYNSKLQFFRRRNNNSKIQTITEKSEINKNANINERYNSSESTEEILPHDHTNDENVENGNKRLKALAKEHNDSPLTKIDFQELRLLLKIEKYPATSISGLQSKLLSTRIGKLVQCKDCSRQFTSEKLMNNHRTCVHMSPKNLCCPLCPKKFTSKWFLDHHHDICKNVISILHVCQICKEKFSQKQSLEQHELKYHDIRKYPFICNSCPESYNEIGGLRKHLLENHRESAEANAAAMNIKSIEEAEHKCCKVCQKSFKDVNFLRRHMKSEHDLSGATCSVCKLTLTNSLELSKYYQSVHKKCSDCEKRFNKIETLKRHIRNVHGNSSSFQCEICGMTSSSKENLFKHYNYHMEIAGPPNYCNICNKQYKLKSSLTSHLQRSHSAKGKEKNYKCDRKDCNAAFKHKNQLDFHLKSIHKMQFKFPCKICKKLFICKKTVDCHYRRIHKLEEKFPSFKKAKITEGLTGKVETTTCFSSESLQFKCPVCNKTSEYKTHFQRHLLSHKISYYTDLYKEQQLPLVLQCKDSECENRYSRVDNMLKHFKKYHDTKSKQFSPFYQTCKICKNEINNLSWQQHVQRHHTKIMLNHSMEDLNKFYCKKTKLFQCSVCATKYGPQKDFIDHLISMHKLKVVMNCKDYEKESKNLECPQCLKTFKTYKALRSHKQRVHVSFDKMIQCHHCERRFKDKSDMKRHMKLVHKS